EVVLDFLKRGERGLPIGVDGLVVGRARFLGDAAALPAVEEQLGSRTGKRPEPARSSQKITDRLAFKPSAAGQRERWKIRGPRHADLRIRLLHAALRCGNIRTPLEQLGRQPGRN